MTNSVRGFALVASVALPLLGACSGGSQPAPALPDSTSSATGPDATAPYKCFTPGIFKPSWSVSFGAINDRREIPGSYSPNGSQFSNFIIRPPYRRLGEDPARGATITAVKRDRTVLGYIIDPGQLQGVWAFIRVHDGLWTLIRDPKEGSGNEAVTELLGANDRHSAVGFYNNPYGTQVAFAVDLVKETFVQLDPPGSSSAYATGVNDGEDVVGTATTSKGIVGFIYKRGVFTEFSYPHSTRTEALGINLSDEIVGDYTDASGAVHGFFLTDPMRHPQWRSFDEQHAVGNTVLTGINDRGDFDGDYLNKVGIRRPFLCISRDSSS